MVLGACPSLASAITTLGIELDKRLDLLGHIKYLFYYKKNVKKLRKETQKMKARIDDIRRDVEAASMNQEQPTNELQHWMTAAGTLLSESYNALNLTTEEGNIITQTPQEDENQRCLDVSCTNCIARYKLGKKALKLHEKIKTHYDDYAKINKMTRSESIPPVENMQTDYMEGLKTMESHRREVMGALQSDSFKVIGVQGMGGVGKTTLMKSINNDLKREGLFKKVVMVTVSSEPNIDQLQDDIAGRLGLSLKNQSSADARRRRLHEILKSEENCVIILDDLWKASDVQLIGIPRVSECEGWKIVLTTRDEDICREMDALMIKMKGLPEAESWDLFRRSAGDVTESSQIRPIAQEICKECAGLPLSITALGSSHRGNNSYNVWKNSLYKLQNSNLVKVKGLEDVVLKPLKLSYDLLCDEDLKLCFLFCSLFPEDYVIYSDELMRYLIGEGVLQGEGEELWVGSLSLVERLRDLGLLLLEGDQSVKMHDVVRDVAIYIGLKGEKDSYDNVNIVVEKNAHHVEAGKGRTRWPDNVNLERSRRISLMYNKITTLPNNLGYKELRTLLLQYNQTLRVIPQTFFEEMTNLLVLDISHTDISSLPSSIQRLKCLKILHLDGCNKLVESDISLLGELEKLEVLSLKEVIIHELPQEIKKLEHLRILDLSSTEIKVISRGIISSLSRLEQLLMFRSFGEWTEDHELVEGQTTRLATFSELASLKQLSIINVNIENNDVFFQGDELHPLSWERLSKFVIWAGRADLHCPKENIKQSMRVEGKMYKQNPLSEWVKPLLGKTLELNLNLCHFHSLMKQDTGVDFSYLKYLNISYCHLMEYLVKSATEETSSVILVNLEQLELSVMEGLKKLCDGVPPKLFLTKLKSLSLVECNIESIFPSELTRKLHNLEGLEVENCNRLMKIFDYEGSTMDSTIAPRLLEIKLAGLSKLSRIFNNITGQILPNKSFENLKRIRICYCSALQSLFSPQLAQGLAKLIELDVSSSKAIEVIVEDDDSGHVLNTDLFPNLKKLYLDNLKWMKSICSHSLLMSDSFKLKWLSLEHLEVKDCPNLRQIHLGANSAPQLKKIIGSEIWFNGLELEGDILRSSLRKLFFTSKI